MDLSVLAGYYQVVETGQQIRVKKMKTKIKNSAWGVSRGKQGGGNWQRPIPLIYERGIKRFYVYVFAYICILIS